ncbi:hypothetical protein [Clostridium estertheticum]|uniref:Uncharacterized protein n=1 Tax=Clostridium estertheticum TaxID=238834 RepID=A0A7Y3SYJ1_9CLOT|nr:hypothetical protein [Clostridium estertheticum]NNU77567.1 hypothetical protein [Clostridium estertheticum]WBL48491.1 hypothetical protein LOR37_07490 [Clostridium estertheticum]
MVETNKYKNYIINKFGLLYKIICKIAVRVPALLKLLFYMFLIDVRKIKRLSARFLKRFLEIWYIGASLLTISYIFSITGNNINFINIGVTVYIIDFLRLEYDRKRSVNLKYFLHLQLDLSSDKMLTAIAIILDTYFYDEGKSLSIDKIEFIICHPNFWNEIVNTNQSVYSNYDCFVTKYEHFLTSFEEYSKAINGFINANLPKDRNVFVFLNNLKGILDEPYLPNETTYDLVNLKNVAEFTRNLIDNLVESKKYRNKWDRDEDLVMVIRELNWNFFRKQKAIYDKIKLYFSSINGEI